MFNIWKNVTEFLTHTINDANQIMYERYYEEDNVLYLNYEEEEDKELFEPYLKQGLKRILLNRSVENVVIYINHSNKFRNFTFNYRCTRVITPEYKDRFVYKNVSTGEIFEISKEYFLNFKASKED